MRDETQQLMSLLCCHTNCLDFARIAAPYFVIPCLMIKCYTFPGNKRTFPDKKRTPNLATPNTTPSTLRAALRLGPARLNTGGANITRFAKNMHTTDTENLTQQAIRKRRVH